MGDTQLDTRGRNGNPKFDVTQALRLRTMGLSYQEIGNQLGVSKQAIHERLGTITKLMGDPQMIEVWDSKRVEILKSVEVSLVADLLDDGKRKSASLNNTAYALRQVHDMRQIREQQPTELIGVSANLHIAGCAQEEITRLKSRLDAITERIAEVGNDPHETP